jgi:hypothetical protein
MKQKHKDDIFSVAQGIIIMLKEINIEDID